MYTCIYNMYNTDTYVHTSKLCVRIYAHAHVRMRVYMRNIYLHTKLQLYYAFGRQRFTLCAISLIVNLFPP